MRIKRIIKKKVAKHFSTCVVEFLLPPLLRKDEDGTDRAKENVIDKKYEYNYTYSEYV